MAHVWELLSDSGSKVAEYDEHERLDIRMLFEPQHGGQIPRNILDIGCAKGHVGVGLKRDFGAHVWGVELNELAIVEAQKVLDKVTPYPIEQFSAVELALLKDVDTITLLDVLEHMYNPWSALTFLAEHMNDDAKLIISLPNIMHGLVINGLAAGQFNYNQIGIMDITHIRFFTPDTMTRMLQETGFEVEEPFLYNVGGLAGATVDTANPASYPFWFDLGSAQIKIVDHKHWMSLNSVHCVFRAHKRKS